MSKQQDNPEIEIIEGTSAGKGRPTPTRKEREAANRRPLVPKDRKAAKKAARAERNAIWDKEQYAMKTGDEANLPANHRGRVRRWGRDYVDARRSLSSWFMPLALVTLVVLMLMRIDPVIAFWVTIAIYLLFFIMIGDAFLMSRKVKKLAEKKFGEDQVPPGFRWMVATRGFYPRRMRRPIPKVMPGEWPEGAK